MYKYHDNGQLQVKGTFKDGEIEDGPWVEYHDNGQVRTQGTYKDGEEDGPWVVYNKYSIPYENLTGTYKNGVRVSD
jgi:antitoxin component YwqK of YwqJK toxin-antitoxin module